MYLQCKESLSLECHTPLDPLEITKVMDHPIV